MHSKIGRTWFSTTLKDIRELLESFVSVDLIEHAKKIFKFGGRPGDPGQIAWILSSNEKISP